MRHKHRKTESRKHRARLAFGRFEVATSLCYIPGHLAMIECFERVEHTVDLCTDCGCVFTIDLVLPPLPRYDGPLRAGIAASEAEMRSIKATIVETNGLLQVVNEELEHYRSVVASLEDVQLYLETMLDVQRAHIAPIRRLPSEVLSEVFMWACLGEEVGGWRCMPVDISQVCKSWRGTSDV